MMAVCIALGSNLGDREANIRMALRGITRMAQVAAVSALYETEPEGPPQPPFYNAACRIETGLEPRPLLRFLQALEHEIGRRPGAGRNAPRVIDLDILLFDDRTVELPDLVIPHPRLAQRAFVLVPLAEVAPEAVIPSLGKAVRELATATGRAGVRKVRDAGWDGVAGRDETVRL